MKIIDLIRRDMVIPQLKGRTKRDILQELAHHIASHRPGLDEETIARVLIEREELASTAIGEGVAIPHGKLPGLDEIVACLGRVAEGVDFDSMDGQPTYLFFVLIAPVSSTGAHLKALARVSRLFKDREFRKRLLAAADADAMYEILAEEDAKY
ncbi:MAG: PTS sugar transporter subunit IIA [Deltaproteobacteria bacterium]|nr:MAG: PTS sugar transporter subunit IIA [Deltaproteobacteria bacterium]